MIFLGRTGDVTFYWRHNLSPDSYLRYYDGTNVNTLTTNNTYTPDDGAWHFVVVNIISTTEIDYGLDGSKVDRYKRHRHER